eukprot:CAMPEP_0196133664 /NCGR_PEP_ID=MMETSP0910-20130528/2793_1 /TAXON_ID=49265 /ORGANISM="Thalassiosira rotula, Strain GSO102" /LENGTH=1170 /DNA_ID=CAMNT_0041393411 /DNA_START=157 /DNA_END=3669 /DNA_ORIENTATION=+
MAARLPLPTRRTIASTVVALLIVRHNDPTNAAHIPFGYQSDSTHSVEYRTNNNNDNPSRQQSSTTTAPADPSSYAGSIHYDPHHHALYMTGATFASSVFDGVDVFELTTTEQAELRDNTTTNDGYWWNDLMTGLEPHLQDVGVPDYGPTKGDCFYAVMALPPSDDADVPPDRNEVKLVHSRRFGSRNAGEACSAMDVLPTSIRKDTPGGYLHEFEKAVEDMEENVDWKNPADVPWYVAAPHPPYTNTPSFDHGGVPFSAFPTTSPEAPSPASETGPDYVGLAGRLPAFPTSAPIIGTSTSAPASRGADDLATNANPTVNYNTGPQSRFRALGEAREGVPFVEANKTRSVRLLMAGHVEQPIDSESGPSGYAIDDLTPGTFDESRVYAFAQQVDVRLPLGTLEPDRVKIDAASIAAGRLDGLHYALHEEGTTEDEFATAHGPGAPSGGGALPMEEFEGIVTSGVESRALLNEDLPSALESVYPVGLAGDPTSKTHYYVVLLASDDPSANSAGANDHLNADPTVGQGASQRSWTDFETPPAEGDLFGESGRPRYGADYRVVVKKMMIEQGVPEGELTDVDLKLAAKSHSGKSITMRQTWSQEFMPDAGDDVRPSGLLFAPSGDATGRGDMLIVVGTTAGRGDAFGTTDGASTRDFGPRSTNLEGFVTKIEADGGEFAGREKFDTQTNAFINTYSKRIQSQPGKTDIVAGVCAKPLRSIGTQDKMTHVYVVGSTAGLLQGSAHGDLRSPEFLAMYPGNTEFNAMEAFLMKIDLKTMNVVWTQQVGAFVPAEIAKGNAFGYGCAVTRDGKDVYLSGLVKANGIATDFSEADFRAVDNQAEGGTDILVASYKTADGARNYIRQIGSTRDDFPSRGNGGITTDRFGNAVVTGNTRGSLMRRRDGAEYRYGPSGDDAAMDVFIMSLERATGKVPPVAHDGVDVRVPAPSPTATVNPPPSQQQPVLDLEFAGADEQIESEHNATGYVVTIFLVLASLASGAYAIVAYRARVRKIKEKEVLMDSNSNLHNSGHDEGTNAKGRNWKPWGMSRQNSAMDDFSNLNIMVEVRNSASGGWHGVYDDEQLQAIDFGVPSSNGAGDNDDVVENSLFMEESLQEIEDSLDIDYEIGDMDDVSDEDLIKAYNDAMALDIEPENDDVEFAMAGIGSGTILDDDHHQIT